MIRYERRWYGQVQALFDGQVETIYHRYRYRILFVWKIISILYPKYLFSSQVFFIRAFLISIPISIQFAQRLVSDRGNSCPCNHDTEFLTGIIGGFIIRTCFF